MMNRVNDILNRIKQPLLHGRRFIAVDIDGSRLRLVLAVKRASSVRIVRTASAVLPPDVQSDDPTAIGAFLGGVLRSRRMASQSMVMCVRRHEVVLKSFALPPGTKGDEIASMVQFQVEKELPFSPQEAVVDFHTAAPVGDDPDARVVVQVAAVRLPTIDFYRTLAASAGAKLEALGLRPWANLRWLLDEGVAGEGPLAVLHMGEKEAEISIIHNSALDFCRSATLPAYAHDNADSQEAAGRWVVAEVLRTLHSYHASEGSGPIAGVLVCGGSGLEDKVVSELHTRLDAPCSKLEPARAVDPPQGECCASALAAALGLAMDYGSQAGLSLDFLSPKRPKPKQDLRRVRALASVAALIAVLLAVFLLAGHAKSNRISRNAALSARLKALKQMQKNVGDLEARLRSIDDWEKASQKWLDHLARISCLFPPCQSAYITGAKSVGEDGLSFTVRAADEQTITAIVNKLSDAGYKPQVRSQQKLNEPAYMHSAEMRLTLHDKPLGDLPQFEPRPADDISARQQDASPVRRDQPVSEPTPATGSLADELAKPPVAPNPPPAPDARQRTPRPSRRWRPGP